MQNLMESRAAVSAATVTGANKEIKMKTMIKFYSVLTIVLAAALSYQGCSELAQNLVTAPTIGAHPDGWADVNSANFHGKYIFANNLWNLAQCRSCHGADYKGGSTGKSCLTCHTDQGGPEACNTCHGDSRNQDEFYPGHPYPPFSLGGDSLETDRGVGVHNHHLSPDTLERYSRQVRCVSCHQTVNNFNDLTHFQNSQGQATIHFDSLALNVLPGDTLVPNPAYDRAANKCSNVYCHGYFKQGNRNFQPVFNDPESVTCGSCHGDPISGNPTPGYPNNVLPPHFQFLTIHDCYLCHNATINANGDIIRVSNHINGVVDRNEPTP